MATKRPEQVGDGQRRDATVRGWLGHAPSVRAGLIPRRIIDFGEWVMDKLALI